MEARYLLIVKHEAKSKITLSLIRKLMDLSAKHDICFLKTKCSAKGKSMTVKGFVMFESLDKMQAFAKDL